MERIKINVDEKILEVDKHKYITAKTKDLKNFGYGSLTESEVSEQLDKILSGKELSIIGMFMKDEIVVNKKTKNSN